MASNDILRLLFGPDRETQKSQLESPGSLQPTAQPPIPTLETLTEPLPVDEVIPIDTGIEAAADIAAKRDAIGVAQEETLADMQTSVIQGAQDQEMIRAKSETIQQEAAKADAQLQGQVNQELEQVTQLEEELLQQEPKNFWAKKETGEKIGLALALIVGGIGQGLSGSKTNAAVNAMERAIDQDMKAQERKLGLQSKALGQKRQDVKGRGASLAAQIQAHKQARLQHVVRSVEAIKSRTKDEQTILSLEQLKQAVLEDRTENEEKFNGKLQAQAQAGQLGRTDAGKSQSEAQLKTEGFLFRVGEAGKRLKSLPSKYYADPSLSRWVDSVRRAGKVPIIGGSLQAFSNATGTDALSISSGDAKRAIINTNAWIRANLRLESGAAIGADEWASEYETYFPMAGDTQDSIVEKAKLRRDVETSLRIQTGRKLPKRAN